MRYLKNNRPFKAVLKIENNDVQKCLVKPVFSVIHCHAASDSTLIHRDLIFGEPLF